MATSEAILQVLSGAVPRLFYSEPCSKNSNSRLSLKYCVSRRQKKGSQVMQRVDFSRSSRNCMRIYALDGLHGFSHGNALNVHLESGSCKCQHAESVNAVPAEDEHGGRSSNSWNSQKVEVAQQMNNENGSVVSMEKLNNENGSVASMEKLASTRTINSTPNRVSADSTDDEAWNLLRESLVYYCGNPIGTIAANDPTDTSILNYDQVFIRDFIPSGIAFLLKGEYDVVRNFILYTLQLQVILYGLSNSPSD